jgi:DNA-binding MarR family transcriptional regulator
MPGSGRGRHRASRGRPEPAVDRLVQAGYCKRDDGQLILTPAGRAAADRLFAAGRDGLEQLLVGWSPQQHAELAQMLDKVARALLGEEADRRLMTR